MVSFPDSVLCLGGMTFQLPFENVIPPLDADQFTELDVSVKELGVQVPVLIDQHDRVLDGHNRLRLAIKHGQSSVPVERIHVENDDHAQRLVIELNLKRRHMNSKQRGLLAELLLKADPEKSNRQIAEDAGVDHKTIQSRREKLESIGEIPQCDSTKTKDGRSYPRKRKSSRQKAGEEAREALASQEREPEISAAETEEKPRPELFDSADQPIPDQAYEAFDQLPEIRQLVSLCDQLSKEVQRVSALPVGRYMLTTTILSQIKAVKQNINGSKPAYVCPYCRGQKVDCRSCGGSGWVTTVAWKQAPAELKGGAA